MRFAIFGDIHASFEAFETVRPRSLNASSRWRSPLVVTYLASLLAWAIPSGSADMSGLVNLRSLRVTSQ